MASLSAVALGLGITSALTTAIGGVSTYQSQKQQDQYNIDVANYNAKLENQEAARLDRERDISSDEQREDARRLIATQRASYGKSGVALTTGTPLALLAETRSRQEREMMNFRLNSGAEVRKHRTQSEMFRRDAKMTSMKKNYGTLLSAGGQAMGQMANAFDFYSKNN